VRKPDTIEHLYLDFDSFFASCEQQRRPELRGRPVGITPSNNGFMAGGVIAASREAKAAGVRSVMSRRDAINACPDIKFVSQDPAFYREVHHAARAAIGFIVPVDKIMSIDEMSCRLGPKDITDPLATAARIKAALSEGVGPHITASIGFAANRHIAKIACKEDKPDGATIWRPEDLPDAMSHIPLRALPGVGGGMEARLAKAGITTLPDLLATEPKQLRRIWGNVSGERYWYVMQGYEVSVPESKRSMIGHGRVLPAQWRGLSEPYGCARMLLTKAARRLRRQGFYANTLYVSLKFRDAPWADPKRWADKTELHSANDDRTCLQGLDRIWQPLAAQLERLPFVNIAHVMISFSDLVPAGARQLDLLQADDPERLRWERVTDIIDGLNQAAGQSLVTVGPWSPPPGGNAGGKIAFNRVPEAEDFW